MKLIDKFVVREVGGNTVAVAVGKASTVFRGVIKLNDCSKLVFEKLQKHTTEEQIVKAVVDEYDVDIERATSDVKDLLDKMREVKILEE